MAAGLGEAKAAGHHLHGHHALAGGVRGRDRRVERVAHAEVVGRQDHVDVRLGRQRRDQFRLAAVRADAGEADLAGFLGDLLRFDQFVGHLGRLGLGVQVPDVQVIGAEFAQAGIQVGQRGFFGLGAPSCWRA